ncbi:hypothetical protein ACVWZ3_006697 [Bradyrhizobium sp. i1.3.6]
MCGVFDAEPHEVDVLAEVRPALAAGDAMAAPARRIDGDTVADLQVRCGTCDLHDFARDLVTEHERRLHDEIAGPGMTEIMHVGAADAAGAEADAHHAISELVERMLDHAQIFGAEQGCGESGGGHLESPMYLGSQRVSSGM